MEIQQATTGVANVNPAGSYEQSFGRTENKTVYHAGGRSGYGNGGNPFKETEMDTIGYKSVRTDLRPSLKKIFDINWKALTSTSGGAGTAGYAMIPIYLSPMVVDDTRKFTPLIELIPRVTNYGVTADYNKITAKGGAGTYIEDASLSETNTTYDRASTAIKYIYAVGRVTGQAMAAVPSYVLEGFNPQGGAVGAFSPSSAPNAKQMEVLVKTRELREKEEDLIVNGNATTSGSTHGVTGANGTEYDGIIQLQSTTNKVDKNTTALSLDDIHTAVQYAFDDSGRPNLAVCSSSVYTDLLKLLTAKIGYLQPQKEVYWGFTAIVLNTMVGEIPVIASQFMSNVSGSKAIYFLDLTHIEMRVLQDMTYEELAKTNDSQKFMLKIYEALIIRNTAFNSFIGEIA